MLYHLHELNRVAVRPLRAVAHAAIRVYRHPFVPIAFTPYGRAVAASWELVERLTRRHEKPVFGLHATHIGNHLATVEEEVVQERSFCRLIRFRRDVARQDPRVLLVAPLSGHHATLLRDTVRGLLPDHDVYVTDWLDARLVPAARGRFDLDDYISYLMQFMQFLGPDTHVIAVCQPAVPALAAAAIMAAENHPCQPRSMTLMGGPIDTRVNPTKVNGFAATRSLDWFERQVIVPVPLNYPGFNRRVYPGFLQLTGFMSMNMDRHVGAHMQLYHHLIKGDGEGAEGHRRFYDEYLSVMDLAADYYLQTIKTVFIEHALPRGEMRWDEGIRVEPRAIAKTALMTVEGELDDISGLGQTRAAHALCTAIPDEHRVHYMQPGVGHFGIFNGRRWRTEILPRVREFIRAHA
ncbi:MAG: polyhydroxyalkanoate depolymerase [Alphaproteobacteria bacterium]|nr:polyhydroxyalkanoate depolymerase [Alphaproteobacteria bacterium]